jgi:hypothetical protein
VACRASCPLAISCNFCSMISSSFPETGCPLIPLKSLQKSPIEKLESSASRKWCSGESLADGLGDFGSSEWLRNLWHAIALGEDQRRGKKELTLPRGHNCKWTLMRKETRAAARKDASKGHVSLVDKAWDKGYKLVCFGPFPSLRLSTP